MEPSIRRKYNSLIVVIACVAGQAARAWTKKKATGDAREKSARNEDCEEEQRFERERLFVSGWAAINSRFGSLKAWIYRKVKFVFSNIPASRL
jgi:hypothetical protein